MGLRLRTESNTAASLQCTALCQAESMGGAGFFRRNPALESSDEEGFPHPMTLVTSDELNLINFKNTAGLPVPFSFFPINDNYLSFTHLSIPHTLLHRVVRLAGLYLPFLLLSASLCRMGLRLRFQVWIGLRR